MLLLLLPSKRRIGLPRCLNVWCCCCCSYISLPLSATVVGLVFSKLVLSLSLSPHPAGSGGLNFHNTTAMHAALVCRESVIGGQCTSGVRHTHHNCRQHQLAPLERERVTDHMDVRAPAKRYLLFRGVLPPPSPFCLLPSAQREKNNIPTLPSFLPIGRRRPKQRLRLRSVFGPNQVWVRWPWQRKVSQGAKGKGEKDG